METRRLGKTGHMSSIVIFDSFALFSVDQDEADAALEMALERGVNHIDVSPIYGEAEIRIGSWIERHGNDFFLACKNHERSKAEAWESLQRSLETLKVDHFDLFQLHGVDDMDTLKQDISSAVMPGELKLWPMVIDAAERFKPLTEEEQKKVIAQSVGYQPLVGPRMD